METPVEPKEPPLGRTRFFPEATEEEWDDWRWQMSRRITTLEELSRLVPIHPVHAPALGETLAGFRMGVTPYYFSLMDPTDPMDPLARQALPSVEEHTLREMGEDDPLNEEGDSPVPGITHRYPDRVLMVVSNSCAMYCRHCTRKRIMCEETIDNLDQMVAYVAGNPAVRDVIVSGGDPLTLETRQLEIILGKLRAIPHVEIIRIGSRVSVTMPQRIDEELCSMLEKHHPIWINTHFNHPRECTPEAARACSLLLKAGIPLNNQSVLLRGVNDSVAVMKELVHALLRMRIRPYYLFQCDPIRGAEHLRTPVSKGLEIVSGLRGFTSGLAVPTYVIDSPGGGGKVPIDRQHLESYKDGIAEIRNYQGRLFRYFDPVLQE
jgi:lysine 2,3-aminomutase